jgi:hypothetical protein
MAPSKGKKAAAGAKPAASSSNSKQPKKAAAAGAAKKVTSVAASPAASKATKAKASPAKGVQKEEAKGKCGSGSGSGPRYFLMKSEPDTFSIQQLAGLPKQTSCWEGVRNYQVRCGIVEWVWIRWLAANCVSLYSFLCTPGAQHHAGRDARGGPGLLLPLLLQGQSMWVYIGIEVSMHGLSVDSFTLGTERQVPGIVGLIEIVKEAYPDHFQFVRICVIYVCIWKAGPIHQQHTFPKIGRTRPRSTTTPRAARRARAGSWWTCSSRRPFPTW